MRLDGGGHAENGLAADGFSRLPGARGGLGMTDGGADFPQPRRGLEARSAALPRAWVE